VTAAVLDTNVIVSGVIEPRGIPHALLRAAQRRQYVLVTSPPIIAEVVRALARPRIRSKYRLTDEDIAGVRDLLEHETRVTAGDFPLHGVATHPEDDRILATAVESRAGYLVTGDAQLQKLGDYAGVRIVSPRAFLDLLTAPPAAPDSAPPRDEPFRP
jgi:putative PIN family toxin of toxin-antitoxin system